MIGKSRMDGRALPNHNGAAIMLLPGDAFFWKCLTGYFKISHSDPPMPLYEKPPSQLKRLPEAWYRGRAWVHWTMTVDRRQRGWLDDSMHRFVRELLLHVCHRHRLICAGYCLMPDHAHFLWMGLSDISDQLEAAEFFRRSWNVSLRERGAQLHRQAFDHVLNETERNPGAFENVLIYIFKNPERAKLVDSWNEWPFLGAVAVGYPDFDPREFKGWYERFWIVHNKETRTMKGERDGCAIPAGKTSMIESSRYERANSPQP